jgi:hypothetical protein
MLRALDYAPEPSRTLRDCCHQHRSRPTCNGWPIDRATFSPAWATFHRL